MEKYVVKGGKKLYGQIDISGAKNAAVAIIPAALMVEGVCRIENIPQISDTKKLLEMLSLMGAKVKYINEHTFDIDCTNVYMSDEIFDLTRQIRASYYLIGSMLGRFGEARTTMPGGCNFGVRPIDQHIKGMKALGAEMDISRGYIKATAKGGRLKGARIYLDKVSVGATINIMIAATMASGQTIIENVAREPHIVDLANFLNSMGADIRGAGTDVIKVRGVEKLHGGTYCLIPDQIEAGTYIAAAAATRGNVLVKNVIPKHMDCITSKLQEMGADITNYDDAIRVKCDERLYQTKVKTRPYPGFPTDMQAQICVCMAIAEGVSQLTESVYETRFFGYCSELENMGARIEINGKTATVTGVETLKGTTVHARDLRAGAALIIAGLVAKGTTYVENIHFVERGYEHIIEKLQALGADIRRIDD